jgi:hypothetical protein
LSFSRTTGVTAHGRHNEWIGVQTPDVINHGSDDTIDVGDTAAPHSDSHALAGLNPVAQR